MKIAVISDIHGNIIALESGLSIKSYASGILLEKAQAPKRQSICAVKMRYDRER
jgi:hypothetical protein